MYIANELKKMENKINNDEIRDAFYQSLIDCVHIFFKDKDMFDDENFGLFYYDEYELKTNCHKDIFNTIYLEINQPLNYKLKLKSKPAKKKNKVEVPELYLNLTQIKKGLFDTFVHYFDNNTIVWQTKYGVSIKSTVKFEDDIIETYYFVVIPVLTYYSPENKRGILYYSNNEIQIEYPLTSIENFNIKNEQTNDLFRQTVLIFKNILLKEKDIEQLPFEIIETILYNVPNSLYISDNKNDILKIVNFIRNNPLKDFKTIDENDFAFSSLYRSMSIYYVKRVLKIIENYLNRN